MKEFTDTIQEAVGIHARPAGLLVKEVKKYQSTVTITKGDKSVNALKLMALMGMGVKCGDTVTVTAVSYTHLDVYKRQNRNKGEWEDARDRV